MIDLEVLEALYELDERTQGRPLPSPETLLPHWKEVLKVGEYNQVVLRWDVTVPMTSLMINGVSCQVVEEVSVDKAMVNIFGNAHIAGEFTPQGTILTGFIPADEDVTSGETVKTLGSVEVLNDRTCLYHLRKE